MPATGKQPEAAAFFCHYFVLCRIIALAVGALPLGGRG
jgi:hypothetical protein